jgi:Tfp pilus assembly protein PilF
MPTLDIRMDRTLTDHRIVAPTPASTVVLGIPNACSDCHRAETAEWANTRFTERYGKPDPRENYLRAFIVTALMAGEPRLLGAGLDLLHNPEVPPPMRAIVAVLTARFGGVRVEQSLIAALDDEHPLVQLTVLRSLLPSWVRASINGVVDKLSADTLAVRLAAARVFLDRPDLMRQLTSEERRRALARVLRNEALPAVAASRERPEAATELGRIHRALGEVSLAARQYRLVLERRPDFIPARVALAKLYLDQYRFEEAEEEFATAAASDEQNFEARVGGARCMIALGNPGDAVAVLEEVVQKAPMLADAHVQLARAYLATDQQEKAQESLVQALRIDPGNETASRLLHGPNADQ